MNINRTQVLFREPPPQARRVIISHHIISAPKIITFQYQPQINYRQFKQNIPIPQQIPISHRKRSESQMLSKASSNKKMNVVSNKTHKKRVDKYQSKLSSQDKTSKNILKVQSVEQPLQGVIEHNNLKASKIQSCRSATIFEQKVQCNHITVQPFITNFSCDFFDKCNQQNQQRQLLASPSEIIKLQQNEYKRQATNSCQTSEQLIRRVKDNSLIKQVNSFLEQPTHKKRIFTQFPFKIEENKNRNRQQQSTIPFKLSKDQNNIHLSIRTQRNKIFSQGPMKIQEVEGTFNNLDIPQIINQAWNQISKENLKAKQN